MRLGLSGPSCHDSVTAATSTESDVIQSHMLADLLATDTDAERFPDDRPSDELVCGTDALHGVLMFVRGSSTTEKNGDCSDSVR
jgi:hypothetical protein